MPQRSGSPTRRARRRGLGGAFAAAGFAAPVGRHFLAVSPEGLAKCPDGWWDYFLEPHGGTLIYYLARPA